MRTALNGVGLTGISVLATLAEVISSPCCSLAQLELYSCDAQSDYYLPHSLQRRNVAPAKDVLDRESVQLCAALAANCSIRHLHLDAVITSDMALALAQSLAKNRTLEHLSGLFFHRREEETEDVLDAVARALENENHRLCSLEIENANVYDYPETIVRIWNALDRNRYSHPNRAVECVRALTELGGSPNTTRRRNASFSRYCPTYTAVRPKELCEQVQTRKN